MFPSDPVSGEHNEGILQILNAFTGTRQGSFGRMEGDVVHCMHDVRSYSTVGILFVFTMASEGIAFPTARDQRSSEGLEDKANSRDFALVEESM